MTDAPDPDKILEWLPVVERLLQGLVALLGPGGTVALLLGLATIAAIARWRADRRKELGWQAALDEKERSVQRLAQQEREWRRLFLLKVIGVDAEHLDEVLGTEDQLQADTAVRVERLREPKPKRKKQR